MSCPGQWDFQLLPRCGSMWICMVFLGMFFFLGEPIETVNGCDCMSCVCFAQAAAQPQIWRGAFFSPSTITINMVWHFEDQYEIQYSTVRWCKNDRGQGRQRLKHGPWDIHGWIMRGRQAWLIKSYPTTWHPWRPDISGEVNLKNQEMQLGNPVFFRWTGDSQKFICVFQVGETSWLFYCKFQRWQMMTVFAVMRSSNEVWKDLRMMRSSALWKGFLERLSGVDWLNFAWHSVAFAWMRFFYLWPSGRKQHAANCRWLQCEGEQSRVSAPEAVGSWKTRFPSRTASFEGLCMTMIDYVKFQVCTTVYLLISWPWHLGHTKSWWFFSARCACAALAVAFWKALMAQRHGSWELKGASPNASPIARKIWPYMALFWDY